jgi:hypothetical protein
MRSQGETSRRAYPVIIAVILVLALAINGTACFSIQKRALVQPAAIATVEGASSPFLKAHMRNGQLYVLHNWTPETSRGLVVGTGELLDLNRQCLETGDFCVPIDSVALFETNSLVTSGALPVLVVLTVGSAAMTVYCISNPKACFGSCPTFYVSDGEQLLVQAEGFSSSIAPALEATDLDALYRARPRGREFEVRMLNEALETHVVRFTDLLVAPRPPNGRVFASTTGEFRQALSLRAPDHAWAEEGDCSEALAEFDGAERFSVTDSTRLDARETIELEFAAAPGESLGLVIASRQTLLTTYLFYQALSFMGRSAGEYLAALERGDRSTLAQAQEIGRRIGGIRILQSDGDDEWQEVGKIYETGPIATDVRLLPLAPAHGKSQRVRLELTRGAWRLDWIALAALGPRVEPSRLPPVAAYRGESPDGEALAALLDPARSLTTFPGDEYTLVYHLPADYMNVEVFLESRGYYLEWMRPEWLAEENPLRAAALFFDPEGSLQALAPEYKRIEPEMERLFWSSRYVRH